MPYQVIETRDYDEQQKERFVRIAFYPAEATSFGVSHGYSYLYIREQKQSMGQVMGLDKLVEETK